MRTFRVRNGEDRSCWLGRTIHHAEARASQLPGPGGESQGLRSADRVATQLRATGTGTALAMSMQRPAGGAAGGASVCQSGRVHRATLIAMAGLGACGASGMYLGLVTGTVPLDVGVGRTTRPLGPLRVRVSAPRETVFDVITAPYDARASKAMRAKVSVLERGSDMVLAAHYTPVRGRLRATTVETVRFTRPERVDFRVVRGPVPHVVETFSLTEDGDATRLDYEGELGTDFWGLGKRWGDLVAARWQAVVRESFEAVKAEAERRAHVASS